MDFHRLTRRDLQALCKKNKIPANMTNIAMADSLKALEIVEGIEEFLQSFESETAQASIESPVRSEVTSPYVPLTGGRSTRWRNIAKEEPETVKPLTRTQRTTRKTVAKYADESQADAVVTQTNRKKGSTASACRKMDSQLKECVEVGKKDVLVTPAPLSVSTQRRRQVKEGSEVKPVYSIRRSVRLAEKNVKLLNEVGSDNSGLLNKGLFTNDGQDMKKNVKEMSGVDANTNAEDDSEKKDGELVATVEEEIGCRFEADGSKPEVKEGSDVEIEEVGEIGMEMDKQTCDKTEDSKEENIIMPQKVGDKDQENDGSHEVRYFVINIAIDNTEEPINIAVDNTEEPDTTDKYAGYEDKAADCTDDLVLESEDIFAVGEISCNNDVHNEIEKETCNTKEVDVEDIPDLNVKEEINDLCEKEFNPDKSSDLVIFEAKEPVEVLPEIKSDNVAVAGPGETEIQHDEIEKCTDQVPSDVSGYQIEVPSPGEELTDVIKQATDDSSDDMPFDISLLNEDDEANMELDICNWGAVIAADLSEMQDIFGEKNEMDLVKDTKIELQEAIEEVLLHETKLDDIAVEEGPRETEVQHEDIEKGTDHVPSDASGYPTDVPYPVKELTAVVEQSTNDSSTDINMPFDINLMNECDEANVELATYNWDAIIAADLNEMHDVIGEKNEMNLGNEANEEVLPETKLEDVAVEGHGETEIQHEEIDNGDELEARLIVQPARFTPTKVSASKASVTKKRMTAVSDNKENIGSGGKLVLTKERGKIAKNTAENNASKLDDLSMRKLARMLKEQLKITNELSKNENEAPARPALQALPENREVD